MIPVPGRAPDGIVRATEMGVDYRNLDEHGVHYVIMAVDVTVADNLNVGVGLGDHGGDILEDVRGQAGLDDEQVGASFHGFHDAEIVDVTVPVEVKVVEHVGRVVQKPLEILDGGGLGERRRDSLQVKEKGDVLTGGHHTCGRRDRLGPGNRDGGAVTRYNRSGCDCGGHYRFGIGSDSDDPRKPASRAEQGKKGDC